MLKRSFSLLAMHAGLVFALGAPLSAGEVKLNGQTFTLPGDLEMQLVTTPKLVQRPISASFDENGFLYVSDSSGTNEKVEQQLAEKPHRILRLQDSDGDGVFDRSVVFADQMMFPEGVLWHDGSVFVGAPPSIWKLTDRDGDGRADEREEWYQGKTLGHCANDIHGPFLGPDGWIYWCKGAFAEQTHERPGRPTIKDRASHIFRCRPDGSELESVMAGGMDNPVDVVFTPEGEPIFTSTFLDLSGPGRRDGLGHAAYGGVFPKVNEVTDAVQRTGDLLPAMTHFGAGAPCGLARYQGFALGREYHGNVFATLFNMHKVTRHVLEPAGATFRTRDSDLLVSDSLDFHPTGVVEDADGSLLVIDTGGWYKICCPTSQLAKPDVLGAIYRIKKKNAPAATEPGRIAGLPPLGMHPMQLSVMLTDPRPAVVRQAMDRLVQYGPMSIRAMTDGLPAWPVPQIRQTILWTLSRIRGEEARATVRQDLTNADANVRQTAAKIAGLWRDRAAFDDLLPLLSTAEKTPHLARVAAEALGRIGDARAVPALLAGAPGPADRFLEHAFIYALIEIANPAATSAGLESPRAETRRAALIALNEMEGRPLRPEQVTPLLTSPDPILKQTASWIVSRHTDWGGALRGYLGTRLAAPQLSATEEADLETLLAQSSRDTAIQELLANTLKEAAPAATPRALRAMARADLKVIPAAWQAALGELLAKGAPALLPDAISTGRAFSTRKDGLGALAPALLKVAQNASAPAELRVQALSVLPPASIPADDSIFTLLRGQMREGASALGRAGAASLLARLKLTSAQRETLADAFGELGPVEAGKLLAAFESGVTEPLGRRLLTSLGGSRAFASLPPQAVRAVLVKFPAALKAESDALLAKLQADTAAQGARLEAISGELPPGDLRRGQAVFNTAKAACNSCHSLGYLGAKFGPDLTSIGKVRSERDLLEAIVFPSASFVRSYEPTLVRSAKGEMLLGILRGENSESLTLATGPGLEMRLPRTEVAELQPGPVSLMPQGYDQILTRQELSDVIAFLKGLQK